MRSCRPGLHECTHIYQAAWLVFTEAVACFCAGVLPFAKRGDDRGNNLIRLQQMFPRIVAAEFQQPLHVSKDCQTLLSRMLTPDPAKRITIGEIMQHPW